MLHLTIVKSQKLENFKYTGFFFLIEFFCFKKLKFSKTSKYVFNEKKNIYIYTYITISKICKIYANCLEHLLIITIYNLLLL